MLAVVDYGAGNLFSVQCVLERLCIPHFISSNSEEIIAADRIIFPGVGTSLAAMDNLKKCSLDKAILTAYQLKKPILGICIGCQILLNSSEEGGGVKTLGIINGKVKKFLPEQGIKIPHMGWNTIEINKKHPVLENINTNEYFYYVHSYFPDVFEQETILAKSQHGTQKFTAAFAKKSLIACQFHPEKSAHKGLQLIKNFSNWDGKW